MKIRLDAGLYASAQAARLVGISPQKMLRWLRGNERPAWARERRGRPLLQRELPDVGGVVALSFLDLIELRMVKAFLDEGVSMPTIRNAAARAAELFSSHHPFCLKRFETDGRDIFARLEAKELGAKRRHNQTILLDLKLGQTAIPKVIEPLLRKQIDYANEVSSQWWPDGRRGGIVINPKVAFGVPVVARCGVPTDTLAAAAKAEGSIQRAAEWFDVHPIDVRRAVAFEQRLAVG